jgi:hypothetical protein
MAWPNGVLRGDMADDSGVSVNRFGESTIEGCFVRVGSDKGCSGG